MKKIFVLMTTMIILMSPHGTRTMKKVDDQVKDTTERVSIDSTTVEIEDTITLE